MADAYLVPCLVTLRAEFNALSPNRDKGADGWIGDAAHAARSSDHNPDSQGRVLAVDIDSTGPWPVPFGDLVESLRGDDRLEYIIWNRRIASRDQGWSWRTYTGTSDPHTGHAHFSARHDHTGNNSTAPWGLTQEDDDMLPKKGDSGEEVRFWQLVLTDLGFPVGDVDGEYGAKTDAAVTAFRKARGQAPATMITGWTGFVLLQELAKKYAGAGKPGPAGPKGEPGPAGPKGDPGPVGRLTGSLNVTGGHLDVSA